MRQLQRLGVPTRSLDRRMARIDYGIAELATLGTAFQRMAAFLIPTLAARYVTERWSVLAPFALAGAREALPLGYLSRRPLSSATVALFEGNALADMGRNGRRSERCRPLGKVVVDPATADLRSRIYGTGLVLASRTYMPVIVAR